MPKYKNTTRGITLVRAGDGPKSPGFELGYGDTIDADVNPFPAVLKEVDEPEPEPEPESEAVVADEPVEPATPEPSSAVEEGHQP